MAEVALPRQMFPNPEAHRPVAGAVRSNTKELGVERRGPRRQASPMALTARAAVAANFVAMEARDSQNRLIASEICGM
jgi:hypothetical protein